MSLGKTVLGAAILVAGFALPARADLTVEIGSTTMLAGGTGTVDVTIKGVDRLVAMNMNFISTSASTGLVSFVQPAGREPFTNLANYVFVGDSSVWETPSHFFGAPSGIPDGSTINGGDTTFTFTNAPIADPATATLVATLYLTANPSATAGDWATISLDPSSSFSYLDNELNLVDYTYLSGEGIVTIATPEPSSIALVMVGIFGSAATRFGVNRRRKTQAADDNTTMPTEAI